MEGDNKKTKNKDGKEKEEKDIAWLILKTGRERTENMGSASSTRSIGRMDKM